VNILFLTLVGNENINERGIYNDLMRKFRDEGHKVYIVSTSERREKKPTRLIEKEGISILKVKTLNLQKTNTIEKGISTLVIEYLFLAAIKKYFLDCKFDLVLYSTPPITFTKVINYIKNRDNAKSYLLLKDIFPQNAVDIGLMKNGSLLHNYFRNKEKELYSISDNIGCMSPANLEYVIKHNPELDKEKIEVNPNSIVPINIETDQWEIQKIRDKYGVTKDVVLFVYGGNLGLPQGIDFLIEILENQKNNKYVYFIIVGSGTMYKKLSEWFDANKPLNAKLIQGLDKEEYDKFLQCSDVGMIFLDRRFTIPNFPSRLLSYLENKKPVLLATDKNSDIGKIAENNNFGLWCESGDLTKIIEKINYLVENLSVRQKMGSNGYYYLLNNYTSAHSYSLIMNHFNNVY